MKSAFYTDPNELERVAEVVRALAHPVRLQIVHQIIKKTSLNVSELQRYLAIPQLTVSQHLGKLKLHKVVAYERKGLEVFCRVDDEKVKQTLKILIG
ncbi:TPA: helix-turn-helix transcriptional regulator [Bacillus thuringiensis]|uniref:Transcriptional regulator n=1 Tax=Bacillus thuringiensis serovar iberica TaxID=180866 RepID=A0A9X6LHB4_BACTU|nr:metalloregulator ArsR/SmtB family transcription factor [Bacillus thuringiensis]MEB9620250.1 metalloregulator ArsR/SmtB family transcription factor [Bacillus cereus]OUB46414.1 transcriptional regulator [Bacillus thuringiensis serovar iberica]HDR5352765.1 helix-turn-helix transcriptional regulator [Bacillus thuringiensis]